MKYIFLIVMFASLLISGCDQTPPEPEEPLSNHELEQRELLENKYRKLQTLAEKRFAQWRDLISLLELSDTELAKGQAVRILKYISIDLDELEISDFPELSHMLKQEMRYLKNNVDMLQGWSRKKQKAGFKLTEYSQVLAQEKLQQDMAEQPIWVEVEQHEMNEQFKQATQGYIALIDTYKLKTESLVLAINSREKAKLALDQWKLLSGVKGEAVLLVKKAVSNWDVANNSFTDLTFNKASEKYKSAGEYWNKAYEQGLIELTFPKLVKVSGGRFIMGDELGDGDKDERPLKQVNVASFNMSQTEITFAQYDVYAKANDLPLPNDEGWGRGKRPVINISWQQATDFTEWLSEKTGRVLRLPTESEWEYAAKANQAEAVNKLENLVNNANCEGCYKWGNTQSTPVAQFPANTLGLHDMQGNVWEWTKDCYTETGERCEERAVRGGSWYDLPTQLRASNRSKAKLEKQSNRIGFRLVESVSDIAVAQE